MLDLYAALAIFVGLIVVAGIIANQRDGARRERDKAIRQKEQLHTLLDYLLGKFSLNIHDPYVVRPGFDERRCYHCFYPEGRGHDRECPWLILQPAVNTLFPASERPQTAPPVTHVASPLSAPLLPRQPAKPTQTT